MTNDCFNCFPDVPRHWWLPLPPFCQKSFSMASWPRPKQFQYSFEGLYDEHSNMWGPWPLYWVLVGALCWNSSQVSFKIGEKKCFKIDGMPFDNHFNFLRIYTICIWVQFEWHRSQIGKCGAPYIRTQMFKKTEGMRLKQNADAYQCKIVLVLFGEKQLNGVYCIFHPHNCSEMFDRNIESDIFTVYFDITHSTRLSTIRLMYDIYRFKRLKKLILWIYYILIIDNFLYR